MATKTKSWSTGTGSATISYTGQGDGQITITSDPNSVYEARSMQITVETTNGSPKQTKTITINQAAKQRIDLSNAVVTAATQTYSGSAKTPTPTVTLNGTVIPSTGYDVSYSNNTNAGTATITITGKGDYTGTAYGTFTINKATPNYTAPTRRTGLVYNESSQYLTTSGQTYDGTIQYSTNGVNWYSSRRTGTDAGDYDCYWRLVGDSNHTDISSTYLGTTSIAKASRIIYWSSYPSSLRVGESDTLSAYVSAGSGDGSISYSSSNSSRARVSGSTVTAVSQGTCTIYASVSEGTNYLSASTSYTLTVAKAVPAGCVDMGVSVFWAECNIGASSPFEYDAYFFSWGNTDGHTPTSSSSFSPYSWGSSNSDEPYASSSGAGLTGDIPLSNDAARQILGSPWRMPTRDEFIELRNNIKYINADGTEVSSSSTNKLVTVNGILGLYLESKINGNRLFFPCSGYGRETLWRDRGEGGEYWASTVDDSNVGLSLEFGPSGITYQGYNLRFFGFAVRAVQDI